MQNITLVGNLTADPTLRTSDSGKARATFSLAINTGDKDKGTERTEYADVTAFDSLGENVASSLKKGQRIVVVCRLNNYKTEAVVNGETKQISRTSFIANAVAPDLRWATAVVTKTGSNAGGGDRRPQAQPAAAAPAAQPAAAPAPQPVAAAVAGGVDDDF